MEISEVRVKLIMNPTDRLKAFCSVTFDGDFVIRDIKIIEGSGGIFVAMPSRKLADHCPKCRAKNHLRAAYCNECAASLGKDRVHRDRAGRRKLHADIAHPINSECRQRLQECVVEAFEKETNASKEPGYQPPSYDDDDDYTANDYTDMIEDLKKDAAERHRGRSVEALPLHDDNDRGSRDWQDDVSDAADDDFEDEAHDDIDDDEEDDFEEEADQVETPAHVAVEQSEAPQQAEAVIDSDESVFGMGLDEEPRPAPRIEPPAPPKREEPRTPAPAAPIDENDDFGAGL